MAFKQPSGLSRGLKKKDKKRQQNTRSGPSATRFVMQPRICPVSFPISGAELLNHSGPKAQDPSCDDAVLEFEMHLCLVAVLEPSESVE
jgi:hypothetical protein